MSYSLADYGLIDLLIATAEERFNKLKDEGDMPEMAGYDQKHNWEIKDTVENEYPNGTWEEIEVIYEGELAVKVKVKSSKVIDSGRTDGY